MQIRLSEQSKIGYDIYYTSDFDKWKQPDSPKKPKRFLALPKKQILRVFKLLRIFPSSTCNGTAATLNHPILPWHSRAPVQREFIRILAAILTNLKISQNPLTN